MVVAVPQLLIVGLGNLPMPATRHSIGQYIVDALASRLGLRLISARGGLHAHAKVTIGNTLVDLSLFKSKQFMNISGPTIATFLRNSGISPTSMIVIQDSLDHRVGSLSVKFGGSANGHNGIKSIVQCLGGRSDFYRFRAGIGRDQTNPADYVLQKMSSFERTFWDADGEGVDLVIQEAEKVVSKLGG